MNRTRAQGDPEKSRRGLRPLLVLAAVICVAVAVIFVRGTTASLRTDPHTARSETSQELGFSVGLSRCTFVDESRFEENYATGSITRGRTLVTEIYYPTLSPQQDALESVGANPARRHGPYPMIVFGHGYGLTPSVYAPLLNAWVKAGFVVAAPIFPDTNTEAVAEDHDSSEPENDDVNQPLDMAFVTEQIEANDSGASSNCPLVHGLIDAKEIGLAGQSDGGTTVGMLAYDSTPGLSLKKVHYQAAAILSGAEWPWPKGTPDPYGAEQGSPPLLVVQSATDQCNPPQSSTQLYNDIQEEQKWFLEIFQANHLPPYVGTDPAAFDVVAEVTTDFFRLELQDGATGASLVAEADVDRSIAHLSSGERAPAIAPLSDDIASCYLGE